MEREISRVRFRYADGREVAAELPDRPAVTVMRERFDLQLMDLGGEFMVVAGSPAGEGILPFIGTANIQFR